MTNDPLQAASEGHFYSTKWVETLGDINCKKQKYSRNFGRHHCPLTGQFFGSLGAKRGLNAHFCVQGKTLRSLVFLDDTLT